MGYYLTACICLNGHMVTDSVESGFGSKFCDQCGEKTITACPKCNSNIKGDYRVEGVIAFGSTTSVKAYCDACGKAFPWTQRKLDGLAELAEAMDELTSYERETLSEMMPHLIEETPRTQAAGFKVAAIVGKLASPAKKVMQDALISIVADAGRKALGFA